MFQAETSGFHCNMMMTITITVVVVVMTVLNDDDKLIILVPPSQNYMNKFLDIINKKKFPKQPVVYEVRLTFPKFSESQD